MQQGEQEEEFGWGQLIYSMPSPPTTPDPNNVASAPSPSSSPQRAAKSKLRKIPPIPARRGSLPKRPENGRRGADEEKDDGGGHRDRRHHHLAHSIYSPIAASSLGLNHIRTRSAPSPLRSSSPGPVAPAAEADREKGKGKGNDGVGDDHGDARPNEFENGTCFLFPFLLLLLFKKNTCGWLYWVNVNWASMCMEVMSTTPFWYKVDEEEDYDSVHLKIWPVIDGFITDKI